MRQCRTKPILKFLWREGGKWMEEEEREIMKMNVCPRSIWKPDTQCVGRKFSSAPGAVSLGVVCLCLPFPSHQTTSLSYTSISNSPRTYCLIFETTTATSTDIIICLQPNKITTHSFLSRRHNAEGWMCGSHTWFWPSWSLSSLC